MSADGEHSKTENSALNRRNILLGGTTLAAASVIATAPPVHVAQAQQSTPIASGKKPNVLVIFGDDIGQSNIRRLVHIQCRHHLWRHSRGRQFPADVQGISAKPARCKLHHRSGG